MLTTPHERLQNARVLAGFQSASEAARELGFNENTYRSHENGERGIGRAALKYAFAFKVSLGWLLTGENESRGPIVSINGFIRGKGLITSIAQDELDLSVRSLLEDIHLPFVPETNEFNCYVFDHAITGRYDVGDIIVCWNPLQYSESYLHDGVIVINDRTRCLQIVRTNALHQRRLEHCFASRDLASAVFQPVKVVVRSGQYATSRDGILDAVDWLSEEDSS